MAGSRKKNYVKYWQLKRLECFPEIHEMIIQGRSLDAIVDFIHGQKKLLLHYTRQSLIDIVKDYRHSVPKAEILKNVNAGFINEAKRQVKQQINVLEEYNRLYEIQLKRINRAVEQEDTIGLNMNNLENSIKTAQSLLDSIHTVQSDLGMTPKHLGTMGIEANVFQGVIHKFSNPNITKVLDNPVSRHKVLNAAERILALAAESRKDNQIELMDVLNDEEPVVIRGGEIIDAEVNHGK